MKDWPAASACLRQSNSTANADESNWAKSLASTVKQFAADDCTVCAAAAVTLHARSWVNERGSRSAAGAVVKIFCRQRWICYAEPAQQ